MILKELLTELSQREVKLWADGDQLRIRAPKDALTKELRNVLTERKAEILSLVRSNNLAASATTLPLISVPRNGDLTLSFAQQRLWTLIQSSPDSSVYNLPVAFSLEGPLNIVALEKSIEEIVRRQEILRTTFSEAEGQPVQIISPDMKIKLSKNDLRQLPKAERDVEVQRFINEEGQNSFDLAQGPLLRLKLLHLDDQEYVFLFTMHHIISDGWSVGVFIRELSALYKAFSTNTTPSIPELSIQYADYAHWQRQWLQGKVLEFYLAYWKQKLGGSPPHLLLPTDRSHAQTYQGKRQSLTLPDDLTEALKKLSQQEGATLFITLLSAFKALLFCYSRQDDIIICSPVACRDRSEVKGLIGYFNNIVVMRTDLSKNPSIRELLGRVRRVASEAYEHQDFPFQKVTEFPNLIRTPLSRAMFVLQNTPNPPLEFPEIAARSMDIHRETADFDLSLSMEEKESKLIGILEYKTDLFNDATIIEMLKRFQTLLENMVSNPEQPLLDLPCLQEIKRTEDDPVVNHNDSKINGSKVNIETFSSSSTSEDDKFVSPRDHLETQLKIIWEKCIGIKRIGITDNFFEMGGHSLLAVSLLAEIEKATGKKLPLATLFQAPTIEQLATILRDDDWSAPWSSLVAIQPGGSKRPFFCAHGAGGHVLNYFSLSRHLGKDQPFYGIQAVSPEENSEVNRTVESMADFYVKEMRLLQPDGPYFLGGYCMGGSIAYEMARRIKQQGQEVGLLALFNTSNWSKFPPPKSLGEKISYQFNSVLDNVKCHWRNLALLEPKEKRHFLKERIKVGQRRFGAKITAGKAMSPLNSLRKIHYRAAFTYIPDTYPGRFTLFETRRLNEFDEAPHVSWEGLPVDGIEIREIPAYFRGMLVEPFVRSLAEELTACIDEAEQKI